MERAGGSVEETFRERDRHRHGPRHPGRRPRGRPGLHRRARRRTPDLRRPAGSVRAGEVDHLADADRPRALRAARARRRRLLRRRLAVLAVRRAAQPWGSWSAWPARPWRRSARTPTRPSTSPSPPRPVDQIAQVDSRYLLGARHWTDVDVPVHCSALGKVFLGWGVLAPAGGLRWLAQTAATLTDPEQLRLDVTRARRRGGAVTADELEVGLPRRRSRCTGRRHVVAALGISGRATLGRPVDELGRRRARPCDAALPCCCAAAPKEGVA